MKIRLDPTILEEHFKDDNKGPLSKHGYMPYLNKFILDKVTIIISANEVIVNTFNSFNSLKRIIHINKLM